MSQRYGGQHSPDGAPNNAPEPPKLAGVRRSKIGARVNLLFLAPVPIALFAFGKPATGIALSLAAFGLMLASVWLLREGLKAEEAFEGRSVARRPAIPRKILAAFGTGIGLGLASFANGAGVLPAAIFAVLGAGLHILAFGLDPLKNKGMTGVNEFQSTRVATAVDEAEKHLAAMSDAIKRAGDKQVERDVDTFQVTARAMFRRVEEDPRDLTAARKYLSVYLMGARDATIKFADFYAQTRDQKARDDYRALLSDLGSQFAARTETLLLDDRTDLDVEIEVLRDRLAREGVKTEVSSST